MENKNNFLETPEEIKSWLEQYGIKNYTLRQEPRVETISLSPRSTSSKTVWVVDVQGDVQLTSKKLEEIPVRFGKIKGTFYCDNNHLTNLLGSPKEISGSFDCRQNKLTPLEGVPEKIGYYFNCSDNWLKNLDFFPEEVGNSCHIHHNHFVVPTPYGICTFEEAREEHIKHKAHLEKDMLTQELQSLSQLITSNKAVSCIKPFKV